MSKANVKTLTVPEIGWLASTIPIAMHVFRKKEAAVNQPYNGVL
jgi:hypothetical protein